MEPLKTFISYLLLFFLIPSFALAQDGPRLTSPLAEGSPAPFSGILMTEEDFILSLENDAAVPRLTQENSLLRSQLQLEARLYEEFIEEQRSRIDSLSTESWWDKNGTWFMFGLGLVLGVAGSAVIVGLTTN